MASERQKILLEQAWLGDAVLALYARAKILREDGQIDAPKFIRMTSNQFLNSVGEPSAVEAELGRVYAAAGLEAAFEWIESRLMPMFAKQEQKRKVAGRP